MFLFLTVHMCVHEREHEWGAGRDRERERDRIRSRPQALSCQQRARLEARTHRPWAHDLSQSRILNWLSHPGAPPCCIFKIHAELLQTAQRLSTAAKRMQLIFVSCFPRDHSKPESHRCVYGTEVGEDSDSHCISYHGSLSVRTLLLWLQVDSVPWAVSQHTLQFAGLVSCLVDWGKAPVS